MNKILIIEDDPLMARMYKRVLQLEGFYIEMALDGVEGYEKAKTFIPDLILLDVMMPRLNGLQTLEKLKTDPFLAKIKVVMLTNLANKKDAAFALQKGAIKYLIKSEYDPKQVIAIIKEVLQAPQN
ncbi:MAG TPA: response regulator [Patescibacteria group bacterium]|nr:response regulator [Patescibacteria group bacterium]